MAVIMETTIGDLVFDLYTEQRPNSSTNFLKLCKMKYYNYCLFHSVRRNFIAQSGDPTGTGKGGESVYGVTYGEQAKYFGLELKPRIKHRTKGTISFVNNGNDMHGSQFFITLGDGLDFLDGKHTVFGQLAEGFDILEKLNEAICDDAHRPYKDIRITHTIILEDPFDDPRGLQLPDRSPEPTKEQLESGRIAADEEIHTDKTREEIEKEIEDKDLQIGTKILETIGDIPDADLKPPENVLFVCKLNPVTNADDLKVIFSRFGKIESCEIIKDHKTGDSLCYGFLEFEKVKDCEKAYFKMDNVLIDDRRIHVDFCQSVGKGKWKNSENYKKTIEAKGLLKENVGYKPRNVGKKNDQYDLVFDEDEDRKKTPKSVKDIDKKPKKDSRAPSADSLGSLSEEERSGKKKKKRKKSKDGRESKKQWERSRTPETLPNKIKNSTKDRKNHSDSEEDIDFKSSSKRKSASYKDNITSKKKGRESRSQSRSPVREKKSTNMKSRKSRSRSSSFSDKDRKSAKKKSFTKPRRSPSITDDSDGSVDRKTSKNKSKRSPSPSKKSGNSVERKKNASSTKKKDRSRSRSVSRTPSPPPKPAKKKARDSSVSPSQSPPPKKQSKKKSYSSSNSHSSDDDRRMPSKKSKTKPTKRSRKESYSSSD